MSRPVAKLGVHFNYPDKGRVYCRRSHKLRKMSELTNGVCFKCPLYAGSMQGTGVECMYTDLQSDTKYAASHAVPDPEQQLLYISDLMDKGLLPVDPEAGLEELNNADEE
jgi:hypothetical protein